MGRKLIVNHKCPLCGNPVNQIPDAILNRNPHQDNCEYVVTRTGIKQYIHTECWAEMIREKRPYDGRMYV